MKVGVYTSESQWGPIMGSYTGGSAYPLWYAHYDGQPSFSDFTPFAGWKAPSIKQFSDAGAKCGVSYDIGECTRGSVWVLPTCGDSDACVDVCRSCVATQIGTPLQCEGVFLSAAPLF